MKTILKLSVSLIAVAVLAGCSITPKSTSTANGAVKLDCTTSTPVIDGTAVTACSVDSKDIDERTGRNLERYNRSVHLFEAQPTGAGVVRGMTAGIGAAVVQGEYAKSISRSKCAEGANCGTILAPSSYANSYSGAQSKSGVDIRSGNLDKFAY